ncbi:hypothetical protein K7X08_037582 [Anisodus acutangulus]|uniref:Uncharacterized protein n=1 Tax=Anisodus acutangulus TaxID=402998 RepID=A0A9Q1MXF2_9SOLA|nr:hypothetical protein K7X08_037582 [Anisodus acutangulus]
MLIVTLEFEAPPNPPFAAWRSAGVIERTCRDYNTAFILSSGYKRFKYFIICEDSFCRERWEEILLFFLACFEQELLLRLNSVFLFDSLPNILLYLVIKLISFSFVANFSLLYPVCGQPTLEFSLCCSL